MNQFIVLTAPPPNGVDGGTAQVGLNGYFGLSQYWYWVVVNYPIGATVSAPIMVAGAPSVTPAVFGAAKFAGVSSCLGAAACGSSIGFPPF